MFWNNRGVPSIEELNAIDMGTEAGRAKYEKLRLRIPGIKPGPRGKTLMERAMNRLLYWALWWRIKLGGENYESLRTDREKYERQEEAEKLRKAKAHIAWEWAMMRPEASKDPDAFKHDIGVIIALHGLDSIESPMEGMKVAVGMYRHMTQERRKASDGKPVTVDAGGFEYSDKKNTKKRKGRKNRGK